MPLVRKGQTWHIDLYANGRRIRRSCKTSVKRKAQEFHDKIKSEAWESESLGISNHTWRDAAARYLLETTHKADHEKDKRKIIWLEPFLMGLQLSEISSDDIRCALQAKIKKGNTEVTANRYLALIRAILRKAQREWDWLDSVPNVRPYPEKQKRIRWLTHEEATQLIADASESLKPMITFALATGLRESNIRLLEWEQVNLRHKIAWIHPDQAKASKPIRVPLNDDAMEVIRNQKGHHKALVFGVRDKMSNIAEWRLLGAKYNIRFHDIRHTWASWHVQSGTPLHVLKELGGWSSMAMVLRYAHLAPEHLKEYAENSSIKRDQNVT